MRQARRGQTVGTAVPAKEPSPLECCFARSGAASCCYPPSPRRRGKEWGTTISPASPSPTAPASTSGQLAGKLLGLGAEEGRPGGHPPERGSQDESDSESTT